MHVGVLERLRISCSILNSVFESKAEVASSRIKIGFFLKNARAIASL